jgi:hypothetical protein
MKTIIAGSRTITDMAVLIEAIKDANFEITEIISGGARGVDSLAERYAQLIHIPSKVIDANWRLNGKLAGFVRNEEMAQQAEALIAIWDGQSKGTKHMIETAIRYHLKIYVKEMK